MGWPCAAGAGGGDVGESITGGERAAESRLLDGEGVVEDVHGEDGLTGGAWRSVERRECLKR